ncbi:MAG: class I SAM-dependent methyltransferase [Acidobacteria bacterium]|nr:MAG: class I SAM-dependent methyltransferase [Acidobacteriota bacterium]REK01596.1 MAG: class I SAM-dependent methyltransferase [Acidobacteriota bacterium]REK14552.1 MAG: class I SAM-dependent methyltransferase [Acidobacteriota bacterium]REK45267.1 MAG: class I SAM-dependent methyltransferase [Acidobacteriota bacterium]
MEPGKEVSPFLIFETINAYQSSNAFAACLKLDLFSNIKAEGSTADDIASDCGMSQKGARVLADTMTVHGFLSKEGGTYKLTEVSEKFLTKDSPAYLGGTAQFLLTPKLTEGFRRIDEAAVKGGTVIDEEGTLGDDDPVWIDFARGMMPMMMPSAIAIADHLEWERDKPLKVLDIAASHGIFGIMIGQKYPNAQIYGVDWKNVLPVAEENAAKFGMAERYNKIEGSAFEVDFGQGYDVALLTNFLHHFNAETNSRLIKKIGESLNPDGVIITLEFIPNDDRVSPPGEALFAAVMLATTPEGDAFTFKELDSMFREAGFENNRQVPLPPTPQHLVISTR